MSLVDNNQLKIVTNVQITVQWYQIKMTPLQKGTHVSVTHIRRSYPAQIFDCNHQ